MRTDVIQQGELRWRDLEVTRCWVFVIASFHEVATMVSIREVGF